MIHHENGPIIPIIKIENHVTVFLNEIEKAYLWRTVDEKSEIGMSLSLGKAFLKVLEAEAPIYRIDPKSLEIYSGHHANTNPGLLRMMIAGKPLTTADQLHFAYLDAEHFGTIQMAIEQARRALLQCDEHIREGTPVKVVSDPSKRGQDNYVICESILASKLSNELLDVCAKRTSPITVTIEVQGRDTTQLVIPGGSKESAKKKRKVNFSGKVDCVSDRQQIVSFYAADNNSKGIYHARFKRSQRDGLCDIQRYKEEINATLELVDDGERKPFYVLKDIYVVTPSILK